jgi:transposase
LSEKRTYRKFTPQQKLELVMASRRGERSIAELCREHDMSESLLRRSRDQVLEAGIARFAAGEQRSQAGEQRKKIAELERALGARPMSSRSRESSCGTGSRHARHPVSCKRSSRAAGSYRGFALASIH